MQTKCRCLATAQTGSLVRRKSWRQNRNPPYEILIRFYCDAGEQAGAIRGIHTAQRTCLIDGDGKIAGSVQRPGDGDATAIPQGKLAALIGAATTPTNLQHASEIKALVDERDILEKLLAAKARAHDALVGQNSELERQISDHLAAAEKEKSKKNDTIQPA